MSATTHSVRCCRRVATATALGTLALQFELYHWLCSLSWCSRAPSHAAFCLEQCFVCMSGYGWLTVPAAAVVFLVDAGPGSSKQQPLLELQPRPAEQHAVKAGCVKWHCRPVRRCCGPPSSCKLAGNHDSLNQAQEMAASLQHTAVCTQLM